VSFSITQVPVWNDNYAYLLEADNGDTGLVDSPEAAPILEALTASGRRLTHIFNTHHHPDHIGSNQELLECFPDLEIWGGAYDHRHGRIPGQTRALSDGETFDWGGERCVVREVPAHTLGHILYNWGNGATFVGDTLFFGGCGRLFEGTAEQLDHALYNVIGSLPPETHLYCAHEYTAANLRFAAHVDPDNETLLDTQREVVELRARAISTVPSQLKLEWQLNPFLRCDTAAIRSAVGATDDSPRHAVLGALRTLKDNFGG